VGLPSTTIQVMPVPSAMMPPATRAPPVQVR